MSSPNLRHKTDFEISLPKAREVLRFQVTAMVKGILGGNLFQAFRWWGAS